MRKRPSISGAPISNVPISGDHREEMIATLSVTDGADVVVAVGTTSIVGTVSAIDGADTLGASGITSITGVLSVADGDDTSGAAGTTSIAGTSSLTGDDDTLSATATIGEQTAQRTGGAWVETDEERQAREARNRRDREEERRNDRRLRAAYRKAKGLPELIDDEGDTQTVTALPEAVFSAPTPFVQNPHATRQIAALVERFRMHDIMAQEAARAEMQDEADLIEILRLAA